MILFWPFFPTTSLIYFIQNWLHLGDINLLLRCFRGRGLYFDADIVQIIAVYLNVQGTIFYSFQLYGLNHHFNLLQDGHFRRLDQLNWVLDHCRRKVYRSCFHFVIIPYLFWPTPSLNAAATQLFLEELQHTMCNRWHLQNALMALKWTTTQRACRN